MTTDRLKEIQQGSPDTSVPRESTWGDLYCEFFNPPEDDDLQSPFKLVSMFNEAESVVVTDSATETGEDRLADLE